ncbi:hypothetical protein [Rhodanobacter thiooxydans]|uniref:hypothetical protein n=1 Tax=Rhodanobacter thiooxydans TaxID=416169 RepID=UPI00131F3DB9|nr:hypothetical protein [Rhodanobacter thiooxydans]
MIVIRGKNITLQPLGVREISETLESMKKLGAGPTTSGMYGPDLLPHFLNVVTAAVRRQVPDASVDEVADAIDITNITEIQLALIGHSVSNTHKGLGHVQ